DFSVSFHQDFCFSSYSSVLSCGEDYCSRIFCSCYGSPHHHDHTSTAVMPFMRAIFVTIMPVRAPILPQWLCLSDNIGTLIDDFAADHKLFEPALLIRIRKEKRWADTWFGVETRASISVTTNADFEVERTIHAIFLRSISSIFSLSIETETWFDQNVVLSGNRHMISLTKLNAKKGGFLVNNEVKIVVEVDVLQVIGKLDVSEGSQEVTQPLKRIRLNDDGVSVKQSIDVNGFQVLPSQVESVKRIFERHPNMALEFRAKNQHVRTSCMNVLLSLIDTLCQSLQDISIDDLGQAEKALRYLKDSDFKVDWLERKLEEVKEKKMEEQIGKSRMQELEEELKIFKQKCSDIEAQLEKEKQKCSDIEALLEKEKAKSLAAARAPPLTLDDVV
ncbi:hypothetical protein, partial [Arabidopsis thaliana]